MKSPVPHLRFLVPVMRRPAVLITFLISLSFDLPAQSTWNGGGADGNWQTAGNWSALPAANSALTFDGSTRLTNTNNFAAGTAFGLINFATNAGNFFLTGNRITLSNNIVTAGTATQTMAMDLTLNAQRTITNLNTSTLILTGVIGQDGATARNLLKTGAGTLVLSNTANTFTGQMLIDQGTVRVTKLANTNQNSSIGAGTGAVRLGQLGNTGTLEYVGTGDTSDRQINIGNGDGNGGSTILNNGSGALVFNNATFNVSGATGSAVNARNLTLGGTNTGANTISGAIANTGSGINLKTISVVKQEAGTWILSSSNAYTGGTTLINGVLRAGHNNAFGTGTLTLSGGTLASDGATARTLTNAVTLSGVAQVTLTESTIGTGDLTLSGPVTTTGAINRTLLVNQLATISGLVDGSSGALFKSGTGTLVMANTANTFSGGFGINSGTVQVTKLADAGENSSVGTRNSNSVMRLGQTVTTGTLEYTGTGDTSDLQINIGNGDGGGGSTILNNGSGALVFDNATFNVSGTAGSATNARTLTLGGTNTGANTISGVIANTGSGSNLKTISVAKTNAGTWVLAGANTYSGTTTVSSGSLIVNGNQSGATGLLTVAANATLGGSGTIGGATTISGTHSPGNSPGIQTFTNGLTYNGGAQFIWELAANTVNPDDRGESFDGVNITGGNLSFGGPVTMTLNFSTGVTWSNNLWSTDYLGASGWLVYSLTGGGNITNFTNLSLANIDWIDSQSNVLSTARSGASFSLYQDGNDIYLNYTAVPEPSTYALLVLSAAGLAAHVVRRRRRRS